MAQAERLALQSDLAWVGEYNGAITGDVSDRMVDAIKEFQKPRGGKQTGVLNPQERAVLAETARRRQDNVGWKIVTDARTGVAARHPHQAGAAADRATPMAPNGARRPAPCRWCWPGARKPVPPRPNSPSARRRSRRPHRRLHRGQAGLLRAVGPAGPEEVLSARHLQGRRGPHPHHPVRPGGRKHGRAGRDRDVERVQCVSDRRAGAARRRARPSNTAPASS